MGIRPRKAQEPPKEVYLVVDSDGLQYTEDNYIVAKDRANEMCDNGAQDVKILLVTKAWSVEYPEEPDPVATELSLLELT